MVTKKETLKKLKVVQLRELAKSMGMRSAGKKEDLVAKLANKIKKEDAFELVARLTIPKPEFEVFKHESVPTHEILSEEEVRKLLEKHKCTKLHLPKIKFSDPAIKYLGAKLGDVIKITRKSATAGKAIYYRVVVR